MNDATLINVLKAPPGLHRFMPVRIVLRTDADDTLLGLCEDSFSMSTNAKSVRIWWSGKAYSMLGEHTLSGINDANYNAKAGDIIYDPLADDCPVDIEWESWLSATDKYSKRNARFKIKAPQE